MSEHNLWNVELTKTPCYEEPGYLTKITITSGKTSICLDDDSRFTLDEYEKILESLGCPDTNSDTKYYCDFSTNNSCSIIRVKLNKESKEPELTFKTYVSGSGGDMSIEIILDKDEAIAVISTIIEKYRSQEVDE